MIILSGVEKNLWQKPTPLSDKDLGEIRDKRKTLKHNKGNLQQANSQHQIKWRESKSNFTKIRDKGVHSLLISST